MADKAKVKAAIKSFDWKAHVDAMKRELGLEHRRLLRTGGQRGARAAGGSFDDDDPAIDRFSQSYTTARVRQLSSTTNDRISSIVDDVLAANPDMPVRELASVLGGRIRDTFEDFAQYRALAIARTESAIGLNQGNLLGFSQYGVTEVDVLDGTDDPDCEEANGSVWTVEEAAEDPIAHPNCERAFAPIVPESGPDGDSDGGSEEEDDRAMRRRERHAAIDWDGLGSRAAERLAGIDERVDPHGRPDHDDDAGDE